MTWQGDGPWYRHLSLSSFFFLSLSPLHIPSPGPGSPELRCCGHKTCPSSDQAGMLYQGVYKRIHIRPWWTQGVTRPPSIKAWFSVGPWEMHCWWRWGVFTGMFMSIHWCYSVLNSGGQKHKVEMPIIFASPIHYFLGQIGRGFRH